MYLRTERSLLNLDNATSVNVNLSGVFSELPCIRINYTTGKYTELEYKELEEAQRMLNAITDAIKQGDNVCDMRSLGNRSTSSLISIPLPAMYCMASGATTSAATGVVPSNPNSTPAGCSLVP